MLVFLFLAIPVKYNVTASHGKGTSYSVKVTYFFRLIRFYYQSIDGENISRFYILFFKIKLKNKEPKPLKQPKQTKKVAKTTKKESTTKKAASVYEVLTDAQGKTIIKQVLNTLKKIGGSLLPEYINVSGSIGLACPFKTGLFFGAYETLAGMFPIIKEKIQLVGDFHSDDMAISLNAAVRGRVVALRILIPILFMLIKKPMRTFLLDLW